MNSSGRQPGDAQFETHDLVKKARSSVGDAELLNKVSKPALLNTEQGSHAKIDRGLSPLGGEFVHGEVELPKTRLVVASDHMHASNRTLSSNNHGAMLKSVKSGTHGTRDSHIEPFRTVASRRSQAIEKTLKIHRSQPGK